MEKKKIQSVIDMLINTEDNKEEIVEKIPPIDLDEQIVEVKDIIISDELNPPLIKNIEIYVETKKNNYLIQKPTT